MTWDETKTIVGIIKSLYPNWRTDNPKSTVDTWHIVLEDFDANAIQYAIKRYALTDKSGFPPSIGQLIGQLQDTAEPSAMSGMEAWALVLRAIKNSGYNSQQEFAQLPDAVKRAVGSPETLKSWALSDLDSIGVMQSNFLRTYNAVAEKARTEARLPESMRIPQKGVAQIGERKDMDS